MDADLDALATRLYVTIDDLLKDHPDWQPERPAVGIAPQLSDAELVTLAVVQALLGYTSEHRFIRYAHTHLRPWFSFLPQRAAYNKRLRAAGNMMQHIITAIARDCPSYTDDLWVVDSTPVECGRSRETVKRSDMAGYASYGYCASHSRLFVGRSDASAATWVRPGLVIVRWHGSGSLPQRSLASLSVCPHARTQRVPN